MGRWPSSRPGTDYDGIDDFTEIWSDPDATGQDEIRKNGRGAVTLIDGGKSYRPGEWTSELKVFQKAGSVTVYKLVPAAERPKSYPSRAR